MTLLFRRTFVIASAIAIALCRSQANAQAAPQTPQQQAPPASQAAQPAPPPAAPDSATLQTEARQALDFIIQREALDPAALVPDTGKPLPQTGTWSVSKLRPASCPPTSAPCITVLYRVPDIKVSCEWVVLLQPGAIAGVSPGTILAQNPDSIRYMLRSVPITEAAPLVLSRVAPPPTRITGTVEIQVIISPTGEPTGIVALNGPPPLRQISAATARQWIFKPLMVGNRAIPFETTIKFLFTGSTVKTQP